MNNYCPYCSNSDIGHYIYHNGICPKVKSFEYDENGNIKKVEFHDFTDYNIYYSKNLFKKNIPVADSVS